MDDRSVGWSEDDLTDADFGEFLDDEFCFVSAIGKCYTAHYGLRMTNSGFLLFAYYSCGEFFFTDNNGAKSISH